MPKSRKKQHGSGKPKASKPLAYNPVYTDKITKAELWEALKEKLSLPELIELEKQMRRMAEDTGIESAKRATEEAYERQFAVMMRVLRDRFGFGKSRLRRLWEACLDYIHDIDDNRITTQEMLDTLEREDGIRITWMVK